MLQPSLERGHHTLDDYMLVDLAVVVPVHPGKESNRLVPVGAPSSVTNLLPQEKVSPPDSIRSSVAAARDDVRNGSRELRGTALVGVQHQDPVVTGTLDREVALSADRREWILVNDCATSAGYGSGVVHRVVLYDKNLGDPVETGDASFDIRGFVVRRDHG